MADATVPITGLIFNWRSRVDRFRSRAVRQLKLRGYSDDAAIEMVGQIGDGTIINWIIAHQDDILSVIKFIVMIIGMFAKQVEPDSES